MTKGCGIQRFIVITEEKTDEMSLSQLSEFMAARGFINEVIDYAISACMNDGSFCVDDPKRIKIYHNTTRDHALICHNRNLYKWRADWLPSEVKIAIQESSHF